MIKRKKVNLKLEIKCSVNFIYLNIYARAHKCQVKRIIMINIYKNLKDNLKIDIRCYRSCIQIHFNQFHWLNIEVRIQYKNYII